MCKCSKFANNYPILCCTTTLISILIIYGILFSILFVSIIGINTHIKSPTHNMTTGCPIGNNNCESYDKIECYDNHLDMCGIWTFFITFVIFFAIFIIRWIIMCLYLIYYEIKKLIVDTPYRLDNYQHNDIIIHLDDNQPNKYI